MFLLGTFGIRQVSTMDNSVINNILHLQYDVMLLHVCRYSAFFLIALLNFYTSPSIGQSCDEQLTLSDDVTICLPSDPIQLNANFSGSNLFDIQWTPATGLSNATILNPTANVTETTTYQLTVRNQVGNNLIVNGDFSLGNMSFSSAYTHSPGTLFPEGVYAVTTDPSSLHTNFQNCGPISGTNMMAVNGSSQANTEVWCQTITVEPNTEYNFSAWLSNLIQESPASLQFSAGGLLLGPPFSAPGLCNWNQFNASWLSGNETSVEICIINQNTAQSGNDFALDDIRFFKVCSYTDEVTITVLEEITEEVEAFICPGESLFVGGAQQTTSGVYEDVYTAANGCDSIVTTTLTVLPEIFPTYIDTTICPGDVFEYNGLTLNSDGAYDFTLTSADGCDSVVFVNLSVISFSVDIEDPLILNCDRDITEIVANISSTNPNIVINWFSDDGSIVAGYGESTILVDQPGTYDLEVFYEYGASLCGFTSLSVTLLGDFDVPVISWEEVGELNCSSNSMQIDATGSDGDLFEWTTISGGEITDGQDSGVLTINGPGVYQLVNTNSINGCFASEEITIIGEPGGDNQVIVDSILPFTCARDTTSIPASGSNIDGGFGFFWSTEDGSIVAGTELSLSPVVTVPGWYYLVIEENAGLCSDTTSVFVPEYLDTLEILPIRQDTLTCDETLAEILVELVGSDPFTAIWTNQHHDTLPTINNGLGVSTEHADTISLIVINDANGCTSEYEFIIETDLEAPEVNAGADETYDCNSTAILLDQATPDTGLFSYSWTTADGNILSGQSSLIAEVDTPGVYLLQVRNTENGCISEDSVTVIEGRIYPEVVFETPAILTCATSSTLISSSGSSAGPDFEYFWSHESGMLLDGSQNTSITITQGGTYTLQITNNVNGCMSEEDINILVDTLAPLADAGNGFIFTCQNTEFTLNGSASSTGSLFEYLWSTPDGNILSGNTSTMPVINAPGVYSIEVINTENGCRSTDSVEVISDDGAPEVVLQVSGVLNCMNQTILVDAAGSSVGNDFQLFWQTTDGNITNLINNYLIEVDQPGVYTLEIVNDQNQCQTTRQVEVLLDRTLPDVLPGADLLITCSETTVRPNTTGSSLGDPFTYQWVSTDGTIVSGDQEPDPVFGSPGVYTLVITNEENHCQAQANVTVDIDTLHPEVIITDPELLTCEFSTVEINAGGSSGGPGFAYQWTTADGTIVDNSEQPIIQVSSGGTYTLTLTNLQNGCETTDLAVVFEERDLPIIQISPQGLLSCRNASVGITSAGSSQGNEFEMTWSTNIGEILSDIHDSDIEVSREGWYYLQIENTSSGCMQTDSSYVGGDYDMPLADAGNDHQSTCIETTFSLNGTGDADGRMISFEWSTADGNIVGTATQMEIVANQPGVYLLTVTNEENGCTNTDNTTILPNNNAIQEVQLDIIQPDCFREVGQVRVAGITGGQSPYIFSLNGDSHSNGSDYYNHLEPGNFLYLVEDVNGCTFEVSFDIVGLVPVMVELQTQYLLELGDSILLEPEFNLDIEDLVSFEWQPGTDLDCPTCPFPFASPIETTRYSIEVIDENGCIASATTLIRVIRDGGIYAPNAFTPGNGDGINDYFTIFSKENTVRQIKHLEIFDRWGNMVFSKENFPADIESEGWDGTFRGRGLNPGVFVFKAEVELVNGLVERVYGELTMFR